MKKIVTIFICTLLVACSSDSDIYSSGDNKIILYNNSGNTYKSCELEPHDSFNNFECVYEKDGNKITFHFTINDDKYDDFCTIDGNKLTCENLGVFEK